MTGPESESVARLEELFFEVTAEELREYYRGQAALLRAMYDRYVENKAAREAIAGMFGMRNPLSGAVPSNEQILRTLRRNMRTSEWMVEHIADGVYLLTLSELERAMPNMGVALEDM